MTSDLHDDFEDVEALIGDALLHNQARARKKQAKPDVRALNRRVNQELDGEFDDLNQLLNEALDKREWIPTHAVVLIHVQSCGVCGQESSWCDGWYTRQKHRTDTHAMRLVKGRPDGKLPATVQRQHAPITEICAHCAESQIAIETVFGSDDADQEKK